MSQPQLAAGPLPWPMTLDCQVRAEGREGDTPPFLFVLHHPLLLNPERSSQQNLLPPPINQETRTI